MFYRFCFLTSEKSTMFPNVVKLTKKETLYSTDNDGKINGEYQLLKSKFYIVTDESSDSNTSKNVLELHIDDKNKSLEETKTSIIGLKRKREQEETDSKLDVSSPKKYPQRKRNKTQDCNEFISDDNGIYDKKQLLSEFKNISDADIIYEYDYQCWEYDGELKKCHIASYKGKLYISPTEIKRLTGHQFTLQQLFEKYTKDELMVQDLVVKYFRNTSNKSNFYIFICIDILEKCLYDEESMKKIKDMREYMRKKYTKY